jgi:fructokinase
MPRVLCFGEILWDCLPEGRHLGGAPFNAAYHLKQLGIVPLVVSAVGRDALGLETLDRIQARGISTATIALHDDLPTGTVTVQLDVAGNASYDFADPAAWDRIPLPPQFTADVPRADAVVFGSLALRHEFNRAQLDRLLDAIGPLKIFDVNLRPPMRDLGLIRELARRADVVKLNEDELSALTGTSAARTVKIADAMENFAASTGLTSLCVTRGAEGALWWQEGRLHAAAAPRVAVRDTIGAGDAFTAALVAGILAGDAARHPRQLLERACRLGAFVAGCDGAQPDYDAAADHG